MTSAPQPGISSWGTELWDQYTTLTNHTNKGLESLDRYSSFLRERAAIEVDYATKLRKLIKSFTPKKKELEERKLTDEGSDAVSLGERGRDNNYFSSTAAYLAHLSELADLAGQHEVISESLLNQVVPQLSAAAQGLKQSRKQTLQTAAKYQAQLSAQISTLERVKKNYEKCWRDSEKAHEAFLRADADLNLSRAEVEKSRLNWLWKGQVGEDSKKEYASQLDKTNELQATFYGSWMPGVYTTLQDLDEKRTRAFKAAMTSTALIQLDVLPIIKKCLEGVKAAGDMVDPEGDSALVVDKYKSGFCPPEPIPFEDLSTGGSLPPPTDPTHNYSSLVAPTNATPQTHVLTLKGTVSGGKFKKRSGLFGIFGAKGGEKEGQQGASQDYAELPPNQRRKKLQAKVDELSGQLGKEKGARDGLAKLHSVYSANPSLGDPAVIAGQLAESEGKIRALEGELDKFNGFLGNLLRSLAPSDPQGDGKSQRSSGSDESLTNHPQVPPSTFRVDSPESGISSGSVTSNQRGLPDSNGSSNVVTPSRQDDEEEELLPVIATAKAVYDFEATSEGSIAICTGEQLLVVEMDQGDGWTRVRRNNSLDEGFVPTSYIEID